MSPKRLSPVRSLQRQVERTNNKTVEIKLYLGLDLLIHSHSVYGVSNKRNRRNDVSDNNLLFSFDFIYGSHLFRHIHNSQ